MTSPFVDVLIPTCSRTAALAVTLAGLSTQTYRWFRVVVSDQTPDGDPTRAPEVRAVIRVLESQSHSVRVYRHLPQRGMAEHRQFLLDLARAPFVLYLDDDLLLERDMIERLMRMMLEQRCGFVGAAPIGLSYRAQERPHQQSIEFWTGRRVQPESIVPLGPQWSRHLLHNAANIYHVQKRLGITPECQQPYKIAWVGGCVLYDTRKLREAGGYTFWERLPARHCGEDVMAQLSVMARYGGCGIIPSGVYHLELPTTVTDRRVNAPEVLLGRNSKGGNSGKRIRSHCDRSGSRRTDR